MLLSCGRNRCSCHVEETDAPVMWKKQMLLSCGSNRCSCHVEETDSPVIKLERNVRHPVEIAKDKVVKMPRR